MYKCQAQYRELCVLRICPNVIDLPGVVVCDRNASSEYAIFRAAPDGLEIVNRDMTFAEYWTDPDQIVEWKKKAAKCAEVLVPDKVTPDYITVVYVAYHEAQAKFQDQVGDVPVMINSSLFFK
jgi:hypothetical protein